MRHTPRAALASICIAVAVAVAACVPGTPGMIGNTDKCGAAPIINGRVSIAAFAGHRVVANYSYCKSFTGIHYISTPAVSTPTANPLGGLYEGVQVARLPYPSYISTWHDEATFDVRQQIFHIAGTQTFTFVMKWDSAGPTVMCLGRSCVTGP